MAAATGAEEVTVAVSDLPSARYVTGRARESASAAGLGPWERSLRVNGHLDKDDLTNGAMLVFFVPWVFIAMGIFLAEAWWDRALCIGFGLIFLAVGSVLFPKAWRRRRTGEAVIHLFDRGTVLERTKGQIFALPYAETPADYVIWMESTNESGPDRPRVHFWITLPEGRTVMLDGWGKEEHHDLSCLAERWGFSSDPRLLAKAPKGHPLW